MTYNKPVNGAIDVWVCSLVLASFDACTRAMIMILARIAYERCTRTLPQVGVRGVDVRVRAAVVLAIS